MHSYEEQHEHVRKARNVHNSLGDHCYDGRIILRRPTHEIFHPLTPNQGTYIQKNFQAMVDGKPSNHWSNWKGNAEGFDEVISLTETLDDQVREMENRSKWRNFRDHELLMKMLAEGVIPIGFSEDANPDRPYSLREALLRAREHGYTVAERFITDRPVSYSEKEAWQAAGMIAREIANSCYLHGYKPLALRGPGRALAQLTGKFIVADPLLPWKTPYVLDQLWIVLYANSRVRLLAMEVDGEIPLTAEQEEASRLRDENLQALGYEVYHVASWWCRVDPYRVVCEFLDASGLKPGASKLVAGGTITTPGGYLCGYCNLPMVRFEDTWLAASKNHGLVHSFCMDRICEEEEDW